MKANWVAQALAEIAKKKKETKAKEHRDSRKKHNKNFTELKRQEAASQHLSRY